MTLRLDWCSHAAAKYAVEHWHYSRRMPMPPLVRVGVWESGRFVGCVLFGRGANQSLLRPFGLSILDGCELLRVALARHESPVTRIIAIAIRMLKRANAGLRLIVSFADPMYGHVGGIYQAGGWIYTGISELATQYFHEGRWKHSREVTSGAFGGKRKVVDYSRLPRRIVPGKHRYLMPLDAEMRAKLLPLAKPYPKRAGSIASDAPATHAGEGGAIPTPALQTS